MTATAAPRARRLGAEWWPRQHGAWAMLFLPYLVAVVLRAQNGELPAFLWPLLPCWLLGYFAFNAASLWLKSGHKALYLRPLLVYGGLAGLFGLLTLALNPALLGWLPVFAPLLGVGLWRAARRDDASLLARGSAVVAACLMCAVAAGPGPAALLAFPPARPAVATCALLAYFLGTLFYVKTMIRERGETSYYLLSVGFHAAVLALSVWAWRAGETAAALPTFFALTTLRAAAMPGLERWRGRRTTPKQVGLLEFAFSLVLLGVLGWA